MLSTGYMLCARQGFPLGRLILAASHTKAREAVQAASRVFSTRKCQVRVGAAGRVSRLVTSADDRITTVLSLLRASARRLTCVGVSTSASLSKVPEPAINKLDGAVMV